MGMLHPEVIKIWNQVGKIYRREIIPIPPKINTLMETIDGLESPYDYHPENEENDVIWIWEYNKVEKTHIY